MKGRLIALFRVMTCIHHIHRNLFDSIRRKLLSENYETANSQIDKEKKENSIVQKERIDFLRRESDRKSAFCSVEWRKRSTTRSLVRAQRENERLCRFERELSSPSNR